VQPPDGRPGLVAELDVGGGQGVAHGVGQLVVAVVAKGSAEPVQGLDERGERSPGSRSPAAAASPSRTTSERSIE
jgi:hypothetical protein